MTSYLRRQRGLARIQAIEIGRLFAASQAEGSSFDPDSLSSRATEISATDMFHLLGLE